MPVFLNFGSMQGVFGKLLRRLLSALPSNIVVPILQGAAFPMLWYRASGVDGYWLGSYERAKQVLFAKEAKKASVVYDVGANVGFYTLVAKGAMSASFENYAANMVYAFEPVKENLKFLNKNVGINKLSGVKVFGVALSDHDGQERFTAGQNSSTHHFDAQGALTVPVLTIDGLVAKGELLPPSLIKIDVEGAEEKVLRGGWETVKKYLPTIFLETENLELLERLWGIGYKIERIGEGEHIASVLGVLA